MWEKIFVGLGKFSEILFVEKFFFTLRPNIIFFGVFSLFFGFLTISCEIFFEFFVFFDFEKKIKILSYLLMLSIENAIKTRVQCSLGIAC